jgi:iron(III) transport system ATP-binding protein
MEALEKVELGPFAERPATNLSGGQQQRLALARSLVRNSGVLLLDEPLSNLDAKLRESMRFELKRMQREFGLTTLYVTHDQTEALGLSSRLAVMRDGQVVQIGKPREIYEQPINRFVADFVGTSNFIECVVEAVEDRGVYRVTTSAGSLRARGPRGFEAGTLAAVSIRPEQIEMRAGETPSGEDGGNEMPGSVVERQYLGDFMDYVVRTGDINLRVRCNPSFRLRAGTNVVLSMHPDQCILIMPD